MKVIIIEDEPIAVKKLQNILDEISGELETLVVLPSVREAVQWISGNASPDVGFFDIQLADDLSFQIFEKCQVDFPVIFTTAYDNYLLKAFEYHSVHYLLKPLQKEMVNQAIEKVAQLKNIYTTQLIHDLIQVEKTTARSKSRFIVRKGNEFIPLEVNRIAYFFTEHSLSFAQTFTDETFMIDQSLLDLEKQLDRSQFFRANRQYIVNLKAIEKFRSIDQSKIRLEVLPATTREIVIAKQNAAQFRLWIAGA